MLTTSQSRNLYGELTTGTANVSNLDFGQRIINAETRRLVAKLGNNLLHTTSQGSAVTNQQTYELPNRVKKLRAVTFTIGSTIKYVREVPNRRFWDELNINTATSVTADYPEWYYPIGKQILYWPTTASSSATITYDFDKTFIDSTVADYTTGTVSQVTNGSTTIVGGNTTWGSAMVGRFIQVAKSDTWANDGDGDWYEIKNVQNTTNLNVTKNYAGHSFSAGAASYIIGEVSPLPDGFHEIPVYKAAEFYYAKSDQQRSLYFKNLATELEDQLFAANNPSENVVVEEDDDGITNQNLYPRSIG